MRTLRLALVVALLSGSLFPTKALAISAPDKGRAWAPKPLSRALYGSKPPSEDPERQQHYVSAHDGIDLYVETWLPKEKDGHVPRARIPTILIMTPYVKQGVERYFAEDLPSFVEYFNARGFAVAQHHVRGTGESGGCLEQTASNQWKDGANVVQYLGRDAPWTNGRVGMYGMSYDAETQISTAGFGNPTKTRYLKAIIPAASVGSQYDWNYMDGVPWTAAALLGTSIYLVFSATPGQVLAPQHYPEKLDCQGELTTESANIDGDYTQYWKDRELRRGAGHVKAATLMIHGRRDFNVQDITLAGFFNRLPKTTPHKGVFGVWNHAFPGAHPAVEPTWARADWYDMVTAWFDRYLKGRDTNVEEWPEVQVQANTGQWWTVKEFPTTRSRMGQLALGPIDRLGVRQPTGSSSYVEQATPGAPAEGEYLTFSTPALKAPLHLTGQPMLDLWLTSSTDDAHIASKLEVLDANGNVMSHTGGYADQATYGVRSLQHIDPMPRGWFEQEVSTPVVPGEPINMVVRFLPTDLIAPKGGKLRLTIAGSIAYAKGNSQVSGAASTISVLHDCGHPSVLRFRMPNATAPLINVREIDEAQLPKLTSKSENIGDQDGDGLATQKVCGGAPKHLAFQ